VLEFRHHDGANQLGDEPGGLPGVPYSDYTGFQPANEAMDRTAEFDLSTVHDPDRGSRCAIGTAAAVSSRRRSSERIGNA
jgi:hypothetical protein